MKQFNGPSKQRGFWGAVIGGALTYLGSKKQADAAGRAAQVSADAAAQARQDALPFIRAGAGVTNQLIDQATRGLNVPLERSEGFGDINRIAAAGRGGLSGGQLRGLTQFNNMLNARNNEQIFNQLYNVATLGANAAVGAGTNAINAAGQTGEFLTQRGNAQAAGITGIGKQIAGGDFTGFLDIFRRRNPPVPTDLGYPVNEVPPMGGPPG
jgi:hypothetical protein